MVKSWITGKERDDNEETPAAPNYSRDVLLQKMLLRVDEVSFLLSDSPRQVYELVKDGELMAHCRNGQQVKPLKITTASVLAYFERHLISVDKWKE